MRRRSAGATLRAPMKITRKLTLGMAIGALAVLGLDSVLDAHEEISRLDKDTVRDGRVLARAVASAAGRVFRRLGEAEALELVERADLREKEAAIRWVWLDGPSSDARAPEVPTARLDRLRRGEEIALRHPPPGGGADHAYVYARVPFTDRRPAAIELRESLAEERAYVRRTVTHAAVATAILVLLCTGIATGLGVAIIGRPIAELVAHARRIGQGDLEARQRPQRNDEIGALAVEMNQMCRRLADARDRIAAESSARLVAVEQLRHADRLMTVGKLAAGVAHELGTPLNVVGGHAQIIADEVAAGTAVYRSAVVIGEQTRRVTGIIRQLLDFARRRPPQRDGCGLHSLIDQALSLLVPLAQKRGVVLEVDAGSDRSLEGQIDAGQIQQVLTNLVVNGIHASPHGGRVLAGAGLERATPPVDLGGPAADYICLWVEDEGAGIPPDVLPHIFEPFYTTKDVGEGSGLGLSVSYGIVRDHGGWIEVDSREGRGSRFSIYLPVGAG